MYCSNDPVNLSDPEGHFAGVALIIGLVFGFGSTMLTDWLDDGEIFNGSQTWKDYLGNTISGLINGFAGAFGLNMLGSILVSITGDTIGGLISGEIDSWEDFGKTALISAGSTVISYGISSAISNAYGNHQYQKIRNVSKNNAKVNDYLKNVSKSYKTAGLDFLKIGKNSVKEFISALKKTTANVIITEISGNIVSTSLTIWL